MILAHSDCSFDFIRSANDALQKLSLSLLNLLHECHSVFVLGRTMADIAPADILDRPVAGWRPGVQVRNLPGYFYDGRVYCAEYCEALDGRVVPSPRVFEHELGHALDEARFRRDRISFSQHEAFTRSWLADTRNPVAKHWRYFCQTAPTGPRETFAECVAIELRRDYNSTFVETWRNSFRHVRKVVFAK